MIDWIHSYGGGLWGCALGSVCGQRLFNIFIRDLGRVQDYGVWYSASSLATGDCSNDFKLKKIKTSVP